MTTLTIYAEANDGYIDSTDAAYSSARAGAGLSVDATAASDRVGQTTGYHCYEQFKAFDTSVVPLGATISSATLSLYLESDHSTTDFTNEVRIGGPLGVGGAFVNSTGAGSNASSSTIAAAAFPVAAGHALIVAISSYTAGTPRSVSQVTDTAGNVYTRCGNAETADGTAHDFEIWAAFNVTGHIANVVTATYSGAATARYISVAQYHGIAPASACDASGSVNVEGAQTTTHTTNAAASTAVDNEIVVGYFLGWDAGHVFSASAPYSLRRTEAGLATPGGYGAALVDRIVSTKDSYSITVTTDFGNKCADFVRTFKIANSLATSDWIAGADLDDYILVASLATSGIAAGYNAFTDTAFPANINRGGVTQVVLDSDRHRAGNTPANDEYVSWYTADQTGTTNDPKLVVVYTDPIAFQSIDPTATTIRAGTTSVSITAPSGCATGNALVAIILDHATSGTSAAPTGWTNRGSTSSSTGRMQVFTGIYGKNSIGTGPWSFSGLTTRSGGSCMRFTGVHNTTPLDTAATGGTNGVSGRQNASGTYGTTTITPSTNNTMIIAAFGSYANNTTWSSEQVATNPGTLSEKGDGANSTYLSIAVACAAQGLAAATGASTATPVTGGNNGGLLFALVPAAVPGVTTQTTTSVGSTTATGNGTVTGDGGNDVSERGHVWNTTGNPTTADTKVTSGSGTGAYTSSLVSLPADTLIYTRAYAINPMGTNYGAQNQFTTLAGGPPAGSMLLTGVGP